MISFEEIFGELLTESVNTLLREKYKRPYDEEQIMPAVWRSS